MVEAIGLGIVALVFVGVFFGRRILGVAKVLTVNAVGGIVTLLAASWFGFSVALSPLTVGITALAGIPGAILILLLSFSGLAFVPSGVEDASYVFAGHTTETAEQLLKTSEKFTAYFE